MAPASVLSVLTTPASNALPGGRLDHLRVVSFEPRPTAQLHEPPRHVFLLGMRGGTWLTSAPAVLESEGTQWTRLRCFDRELTVAGQVHHGSQGNHVATRISFHCPFGRQVIRTRTTVASIGFPRPKRETMPPGVLR